MEISTKSERALQGRVNPAPERNKMKIKVYQINDERDYFRRKFRGSDDWQPFIVDPRMYDLVYNGEVNADNIEDVFMALNVMPKPAGYHGHSLSVSDVVVTDEGAFFCDSVGWKKINFGPVERVYVVCIDETQIRDAQIYTGEDNEYTDDGWEDGLHPMFIGVYHANSADEAVSIAAEKSGYPGMILYAFEPTPLKGE